MPDVEQIAETTPTPKTLSELDLLAVGFIDGKIDITVINNLDTYNRWLVLSLSAIYSNTKIGLLSCKGCVKAKYNLLIEYRRFRTATFFSKAEHMEWIDRTKESSGKLCELAKAINNKNPNMLLLALQIIDLLTQDDVYQQMFISAEMDEHFKENCLQTLKDAETFFFTSFGNIPYVDLLFKFYSATSKSRAAEIFAELDDDNLKKVARHVPIKSDDVIGINNSYKALLNIKDN